MLANCLANIPEGNKRRFRGFGELGPSTMNVDMLLDILLIVRVALGSTALRKLKEVNVNEK